MSFARYSVTGGVATAAHYAVLALLVEGLKAPAALAAALGALCGAAVAYLGNRRFTFSATTVPHRHAAPRFLLVAALGAAVSAAIVGLGTAVLHAHYLASQVVATALVLLLTYGLNRRWTFA